MNPAKKTPTTAFLRVSTASIVVAIAMGCGGPQLPQQQTATFSVTFTAESDPGQALEGVVVKANGREVGRSDPFGLVQTMLRGPSRASVANTQK